MSAPTLVEHAGRSKLTSNLGVAVESSNARIGEERGHDGADEASDTVESEAVDSVVNLEKDLDARAVVGSDGGDESDSEGSGSPDESGGGGDSTGEAISLGASFGASGLAYPTRPATIPEQRETAEYFPV